MKKAVLIMLLFTGFGFVLSLYGLQLPAAALWFLLFSAAALWGWAAWRDMRNANGR
ncbi:hypothetical protein [Halopseudomonas xiamenensis]|uniref:hypothetical protein n=1 Tax=Halopseudomonas xiamenensis TaxID=157792 RepID=UPI0016234572|nr:hypothetical protein [Halopseudomonas xiamenensis]